MFLCEDDLTLEQVAWKGCGFSLCRGGEHMTGRGPAAACSS